METKKVLAWWSKVCPGCNIGRKYPESFIGKKVRNHWEKGCPSHDAYVEVYNSEARSLRRRKTRGNLIINEIFDVTTTAIFLQPQ
ncbi:MAG: hypothetical protein JRE61_15220 [Deltaproteobacteria bacterium]|nr:hypothetical protein [Deltaproteobacteria bacterium]